MFVSYTRSFNVFNSCVLYYITKMFHTYSNRLSYYAIHEEIYFKFHWPITNYDGLYFRRRIEWSYTVIDRVNFPNRIQVAVTLRTSPVVAFTLYVYV